MNNVGHEFFVLMVKREDGQVYCDLAKSTEKIYLLKSDADKDALNMPGYHIVKLVAFLPSIDEIEISD